MSSNNAMRLGFIGLGNAGFPQYQAAATVPGLSVVAVAEPHLRPDRKESVRVPVHAEWRRMLEEETLDAVSICLPHHLHLEVALAAFEAGKHVLLEKPIAGTLSDAKRIVEASRATRRTLMIEMTHRFYPAVRAGHEMLRSGRVGRIYAVEDRIIQPIPEWAPVQGWLLQQESAGGGVALTNGIHMLDRIAWVSGQSLRFHDGIAGRTHHLGDVEDTASMQLSLADGTPVSFLAAWSRGEGSLDDELTIYGNKGTLRIWAWRGWRLESTEGTVEEHLLVKRGRIQANVGMRGALVEFTSAICEGRPASPSGEELLPAQEIIEQFYERTRSRR